MSANFILKWTYRCTVMAAGLLILYAAYDALKQDALSEVEKKLLIALGAMGLVSAVTVWLRRSVFVYVQIIVISILVAIYFFEYQRVDPINRKLHLDEFWELVKTNKAAGVPIMTQIGPVNFVIAGQTIKLPSGDSALPLAGVANLPTIMCREGKQPFAQYVADEFGFNNPKGIWDKPVDIALVGDSFTYGACVADRDHFIAQIRDRYPGTLSIANGGIGPLVELALMREFVPHIRPKIIFYMYDENNDLYFVSNQGDPDLVVEARHPLLSKYLDDQFSQHLFEHHSEFDAVLKQDVEGQIDAALRQRRPLNKLLRFLSLPLTRLGLMGSAGPTTLVPGPVGSEPPAPDTFELFKKIFPKMVRIANDANSRLVFVNIPAQGTVCDGVVHPLKQPVFDFVKQTGVDFIDLETDFRNAVAIVGPEALFADPPCGGHFNKAGYKIIGDRLMEYLALRGPTGQQSLPDAGAALPAGWLAQPVPGQILPPANPSEMAVTNSTTITYDPYVNVDNEINASPGRVDRRRGVSLLGHSYVRSRGGDALRVTVRFTAYSAQDSEIVAALFVGNDPESSGAARRKVKGGTTATIQFEYVVERITDTPISLEVRIGTTEGDKIFINGNDRGPIADAGDKPFLMIEELASRGRVAPSSQFVFSGAALTKDQILDLHRSAARRMRDAEVVSAHSEGIDIAIKRWVNKLFGTSKVAHFELEYASSVKLDQVIDAAEGVTADVEGEAILGYAITPKSPGDITRVEISVPAHSIEANTIVVAAFINGAVGTTIVKSQPVPAGRGATATLEFTRAIINTQPISFSIRVGPGKPGVLFLNSDEKGSLSDIKPKLTIDEYRPFWR